MGTHHSPGPARFLTLADAAELLSISTRQAHALVRSGELPAIRLGAQGGWRVERSVLDGYIAAKYEEARRLAAWRQAEPVDVSELFAPRHGLAGPSAR